MGIGCASVVNTQSSSDSADPSSNNRKRYLSVSAIQNECCVPPSLLSHVGVCVCNPTRQQYLQDRTQSYSVRMRVAMAEEMAEEREK
jgi:hypothetical protein